MSEINLNRPLKMIRCEKHSDAVTIADMLRRGGLTSVSPLANGMILIPESDYKEALSKIKKCEICSKMDYQDSNITMGAAKISEKAKIAGWDYDRWENESTGMVQGNITNSELDVTKQASSWSKHIFKKFQKRD